ncbi:ileal sodium/bile acid cotransporter-like [Lytechinus variegatus]|uniref:ileal sodium/bile acid cotransporter-like n=1 Tax=Lytechinus variegatus TaxID=7654 RepID=UPI001BB10741|nr:ileal sodium/bile acid cotransporter-like [Lytechinus variegatus]
MATTTEAMATVATTTRTTTTESMMSTAIGITTEVLSTIASSNSTGSDCGHHGDGGDAKGGGHKNIDELKLANQCVLGITLGLTMVAMGAAIDVKDFKIVLRRPVGVAVGFLCQVVLMPLIGFIMAVVLNLEAPYALGALIVASCPGGTTSNLYTFWTNGDICLSVIMTTISTIVAMGSMPLNLYIYSRRWISGGNVIPYTDIVITLVTIIGPVGLGMLLRWKSKKWATLIGKPFGAIGMLGIIVSIFITSYINPKIWTSSWKLYVASIAHLWIGWGMGYSIARLLRQPHRQSRTIAFETGAQHVGLALTLIAFSYKSDIQLFLQIIIYPMLFGPFSIITFSAWVLAYKVYRHYRPEETENREEDGEGKKEIEEKKEKPSATEMTNGVDIEKGEKKENVKAP